MYSKKLRLEIMIFVKKQNLSQKGHARFCSVELKISNKEDGKLLNLQDMQKKMDHNRNDRDKLETKLKLAIKELNELPRNSPCACKHSMNK